MNTLQQSYTPAYKQRTTANPLKKFINWCDQQEQNRFLWLAIGVVGHGCVFTIITISAVLLSGNHFIFWPFAIAAMGMTLVSNLAALPTRITIPVFFFSLLIDLVIIGMCIAHGFDITTTYV